MRGSPIFFQNAIDAGFDEGDRKDRPRWAVDLSAQIHRHIAAFRDIEHAGFQYFRHRKAFAFDDVLERFFQRFCHPHIDQCVFIHAIALEFVKTFVKTK